MKYCRPKPRPILGLDIGKKRIGLAYCDALNITVSILPAIKRLKDSSEIKIIKNHISNHNIHGIVIGLPLDEKGKITDQSEDCRKYGEFISNEIKLPYGFVNEHSSTWESINRFGIKKDKSGLIDSYSAKIILEQWIREGPELKEFDLHNKINYQNNSLNIKK